MRDGPTVFAWLQDKAIKPPVDDIVQSIEGPFAQAQVGLVERITVMLRQAYIEGVRDGWQQGLIAAEAAKPLYCGREADRAE